MISTPDFSRFSAVLEEAAVGTWTWLFDTDVLEGSSVSARLHGRGDDRFTGTLKEYLSFVQEEDRDTVLKTLREVARARSRASLEYRIRTPGGSVRWIHSSAAYHDGEAGAVVSGIFVDVTPRKHREREIAVQQTVARLVSEMATLEELGSPLLSSLGTILSWDYGELWLLPERAESLSLLNVWSRDEIVATQFQQKTRELVFTRGYGLPGETWDAGSVLWERDLAARGELPRSALAAEVGLHSAVAFPILVSGDVRGVVVFYARYVEERDEELTNVLGFVGLQLGQALERQSTLAALSVSEQRYRALADTAPDAILTLDERGAIVFANQSTERIFGYPLSEIIGKPLAMLMPARFRELHSIGFDRYMKTGIRQIPWSGVELPGLHRDGYEIPLEIAFSEFHQGAQTYITGVARDIRKRVRDAEALRIIADASRALTESLDTERIVEIVAELCIPRLADWCAVDLIDDQGVIRTAVIAHREPERAERLRALLAASPFPADAPAGPPQVLRTGTPEMRDVNPSLLRRIAASDEQLEILRELDVVSYICVPLTARGKIIGALTLATAESRRRFDEADLSIAQELAVRAFFAIENARLYSAAQELNRAKDQFLAQLSHELRTPITSVLGYAQLIEQGQLDGQQMAEAIESIKASAHAQSTLVEELLDISRAITGKFHLNMAPIDLKAPVRAAIATVHPAAQAKGIHLVVADADSGCAVLGDESRLHQIAWNLLSNAIKFTSEGGTVTTRIFCESDRAILQVSDTGQGIAPEFLPRVFDRFAQDPSSRVGEGLGLGLSIVRHLVELHGGEISASSEGIGKGATFRVTLPLLGHEDSTRTA